MFNITKSLRRIITLFFGLLIIIVMSLFSFVGEKKIYETLEEEANAGMLKTAKQVAQSIGFQINIKLSILESIASTDIIRGFKNGQVATIEKKLLALEDEYHRFEKLEIKRFGIFDTNGIAHYTDGRTLYLGDQEHFQKALKGENAISRVLISRYENAPIFAYTTPIRDYKTDEISGVLFAAMDASC